MKKTAARMILGMGVVLSAGRMAGAETCTTQSQMVPADRTSVAETASALASRMQMADAAGLRSLSIAEVAKDFAGISETVSSTAPRLKGTSLVVEQVYLLDATKLKAAADGGNGDAQFYCTLNRTSAEVNLLIPALPPGRYAFAIVTAGGVPAPWRLSFLLRQEQGKWLMAGLYPRPLTAAGHDGLWYWTQARQMVARKEPWNAWLYLHEAESLMQPAGFVESSHLEKLQAEVTSAAPPALSDGVGPDTPLVVKAKDGAEYRFTGLGVDDSLGAANVDVAVHMKVDALGDQAAARKRNIAAMSALLAAYPEMRKPFHGIWVFADVQGQSTYATEQAMSDLP